MKQNTMQPYLIFVSLYFIGCEMPLVFSGMGCSLLWLL